VTNELASECQPLAYDLPKEIVVTADGPVRIITLNRPDKLNAVNEGLHFGLANVWGQIGRDRQARSVVLTGSGSTFCAGGDLSWLGALADLDLRRSVMREAKQLVEAMVGCHLPIVAAVRGAAIGLGASLLCLSDLVVMSDSAFIADPHVLLGLVAGDGGAVAWPLMMSLLKAKEFLLLGDRVPAADAERFGLANRLVADDLVLDEAMQLAHRLAALPASAVQDTKRALNLHMTRAVNDVLDFAVATESECFVSPEHAAKISKMRESI
jgi:enoyl-CoA hydratase